MTRTSAVRAAPSRFRSRTAGVLRAAVAVLALVGGAAFAEDIVVLSLVGKRLTIVTPQPEVGTHLDPNVYNVLALPDSTFDDAAAFAAERAIRAARPSANVVAVRAPGPSPDEPQGGWLRPGSPELAAIVARVARDVPSAPGARLLLVLPHRDSVTMSSYSGLRGTGSAAGIGLYLGGGPVNRDPLPGFLGVFANLQLVLVDLATSKIIAQQRVAGGETHSAGMAPGVWNALPGERKVEALKDVLQREVERRMPEMVGSASPGR